MKSIGSYQGSLGVSLAKLRVALSAASPRTCCRAVGFPLQSLTRNSGLLSLRDSLVIAVVLAASGCSRPASTPDPRLLGEWMSDTASYEGGPWREFLYIDSTGSFMRATWWASEYVNDTNLRVAGTQILLDDSTYYSVDIIDSLHIEVTRPGYHGRFGRSTPVTSEYYQDWKNRFLVGNTSKQKLVGEWRIVGIPVVRADSSAFIPDEYLKEEAKRPFLGGSPIISVSLTFSLNNEVKVVSDSSKSDFKFTIDDEKISIPMGDTFYNHKYAFNNDTLRLTQSRGVIYRDLLFLKTDRR